MGNEYGTIGEGVRYRGGRSRVQGGRVGGSTPLARHKSLIYKGITFPNLAKSAYQNHPDGIIPSISLRDFFRSRGKQITQIKYEEYTILARLDRSCSGDRPGL